MLNRLHDSKIHIVKERCLKGTKMMTKRVIFCILNFLFFFNYSSTIVAFSQIQFHFPQKILYNLLKYGEHIGKCEFKFTKQGKYENTFGMTMTNLKVLGFNTDEIHTSILKNDLSLYRTLCIKDNKKKYEIVVKKGYSLLGSEETIISYKTENSKANFQTEICQPYKIIDLLSSFILTSQKVAKGNYTNSDKYTLFLFDGRSLIVEIVNMGDSHAIFQGNKVGVNMIGIANKVETNHQDYKLFQFSIYKTSDNFYFPIRIKISINIRDNASIDLIADKIIN